MQFNLRDVERSAEGIHIEAEVDVNRVADESQQVKSIGCAHAHATAMLRKAIYHVEGKVCANVSYVCSRCLESFAAEVEAPLDVGFTTVQEKADDEVTFVKTDVVQLDGYVEEALFLALAYNPVCSLSCRGLCPTCGQNWNEKRCTCDNRKIDPRLAALGDLLSSHDSE